MHTDPRPYGVHTRDLEPGETYRPCGPGAAPAAPNPATGRQQNGDNIHSARNAGAPAVFPSTVADLTGQTVWPVESSAVSDPNPPGDLAAAEQYEWAGTQYANECCRRSALLIRQFIPAAEVLIFHKDESIEGNTQIDLITIRDENGNLLWYNHVVLTGHPDTETLEDPSTAVLPSRAVPAIEHDLGIAYDADAGHFDTSAENAPGFDEPNLLELPISHILAADATRRAGRHVTVTASDGGPPHHYYLLPDDTIEISFSGHPAVGIDYDGPGTWVGEDREEWDRLLPGGTITDRHVVLMGMDSDQYRRLHTALRLSPGWLGKWKGPSETKDIYIDLTQVGPHWLASERLDLAIDFARSEGRPYQETRTVRYPGRGTAPEHSAPETLPDPSAPPRPQSRTGGNEPWT